MVPEKFDKTIQNQAHKTSCWVTKFANQCKNVSMPVVEKYQLDVNYTHGLFVEEKKTKSRKVISFSYHLQKQLAKSSTFYFSLQKCRCWSFYTLGYLATWFSCHFQKETWKSTDYSSQFHSLIYLKRSTFPSKSFWKPVYSN